MRMLKSIWEVKNRVKLRYPALWSGISWWYYEWPLLVCLFDSQVLRTIVKNRLSRRRALFYPTMPIHEHTIYKILYLLGYSLSNDISHPGNVVVSWSYDTYKSRCTELEEISRSDKVLNLQCTDISKEKVATIFHKVFGYDYAVNPLTYSGLCVKKSNINARHDGVVINCPIDNRDVTSVYQKVVNNQVDGGLVMDIRVPIIGTHLPYAYLKYRPLSNRFSNANTKALVVDVETVISVREREQILCFAKEMGLDFGEIDFARDRDDGRLYALDVNSTPGGPPNHISLKDWIKAMKMQTMVFKALVIDAHRNFTKADICTGITS